MKIRLGYRTVVGGREMLNFLYNIHAERAMLQRKCVVMKKIKLSFDRTIGKRVLCETFMNNKFVRDSKIYVFIFYYFLNLSKGS